MEYAGIQIRQEPPEAADGYRRAFAQGIESFIARMNADCREQRDAFLKPDALVRDPEGYRERYRKMLGLDVFSEPASVPAELQYAGSDEMCRIYRLVVWICDEIPVYSLLMIPHGVKEPMPLVITQHGGGGTPELCSDMNGKNNYSHMVRRVLARGAAALAPQLLLWSQTEIETARAHPIPYERGKADWNLKRFGTSITALEITGISRSLDYVLSLPQINPERVAMIGLSYGGYYTLHTMAADTRIKAGYSAAAFNDRDAEGRQDWVYPGSALMFQDAEVAALCAPRRLYVQVGREDAVFDYRTAIPEAERVKKYYEAYGCPGNYIFDLWEGGHRVSDYDTGYDFLFEAFKEKG